MRDLMLGLQVLTGASVTTFLQLLHVRFTTTQSSAPVIPVVEFYNSKDGFLLGFFFFTTRLCTELDQQCRIYHPRPTWPPQLWRFHRTVSTCVRLACAFMCIILSLITSLVESVTSMFTKANVLVISFVFPKVAPLSRNRGNQKD